MHAVLKFKFRDYLLKKNTFYSRIHERVEHEGVRYPCPHCDYKSKNSSYLRKHIQVKSCTQLIFPHHKLNKHN